MYLPTERVSDGLIQQRQPPQGTTLRLSVITKASLSAHCCIIYSSCKLPPKPNLVNVNVSHKTVTHTSVLLSRALLFADEKRKQVTLFGQILFCFGYMVYNN